MLLTSASGPFSRVTSPSPIVDAIAGPRCAAGTLALIVTLLGLCLCLEGCSTSPAPPLHAADHTGLWRSDFQAFRRVLQQVADTGKVPSLHQFGSRLRKDRESVYVITDGAGGFVDLTPEPGSVQSEINHYFTGARVRWGITLSEPPVQGVSQTAHLYPAEFPGTTTTGKSARYAEVLELEVPAASLPAQATLGSGDTVVVEGTIGSLNDPSSLRSYGVSAACHYREGGRNRTVFLVRLEDAKVIAQSENSLQ